MPIRQLGGEVCVVRIALSPLEIPDLLAKHVRMYPGGLDCEKLGQSLIAKGFEPEASADFVSKVCKWGNGDRNISRLLQKNSSPEIAQALSDAISLSRAGQTAEGVERIRRLHHLGQSFASKQLRFLDPSRAVVMDSIIRSQLGYPETPGGYSHFLSDCQDILAFVQQSRQIPDTASLRVCDIEAALFTKIQGV